MSNGNMNGQSDYKFLAAAPAIFVEIFLPKKARYQGTLYNTLTAGFELDYDQHFNGSLRTDIESFLTDFPSSSENIKAMLDEFIERNTRHFFGYSMYEVDGVFVGKKEPYYEERTQVIKLIFKPDVEGILKGVITRFGEKSLNEISKLRRIIRRQLSSHYEKVSETESEDVNEEAYIKRVIKTWSDDVGIFLFGYIIYELSRGVNKVEEEIWVTSIWGAKVNVVIKNEPDDVAGK
jgi:hypothetical protein